jgi:type II secretory pathway pseudopilin PulG
MRELLNKSSGYKRSSGDTIVEVILCIAIAGLVIAGSYALAGNSLRQGVTASERTEALKIAEGQIETLKFRNQRSTSDVWQSFSTLPEAQDFCLDDEVPGQSEDDLVKWKPQKNTSGGNFQDLHLKADGGPYDPVCNVPAASRKYFINITTSSSQPVGSSLQDNPTYLVTVRWEGVNGVINESKVYYRF